MLVSLSGERVIGCELSRPLQGAWHAVIRVDAAKAPVGSVTLQIGTLTLSGTVVAGADYEGTIWVRVVGGAGGLSRPVGAKFYEGANRRTIATDTLTAVGEKLDPSSDASLLSKRFAQWARPSSAASVAMTQLLADTTGAVWRTRDDGAIWIGQPTYPARTVDLAVLGHNTVERRLTVSTDDPTIDANATIDGRRVGYVRTTITGAAVRSEIFYL